jgi:YMGG-like Gly-zipper
MKHIDVRLVGVLVGALAVSSCVGPMGPTIPVMPGPGKSFNAFNADQAICQQYANSQTAPMAQAANNQALGTALLTTALGAGLGAAVGGGRGAAIGAASGAVVGTSIGASNAQMSGMSLQQQYDIFYAQCMYAKGNRVPGFSPGEYGLGPYPAGPGYGPGTPVPPPPPPHY